jgi:hypothetical protein
MWSPKRWVVHRVEYRTLEVQALALGMSSQRLRDLRDAARMTGSCSALREEIHLVKAGLVDPRL